MDTSLLLPAAAAYVLGLNRQEDIFPATSSFSATPCLVQLESPSATLLQKPTLKIVPM